MLYNGYPEEAGVRDKLSLWKPLVLLIPLRLGLTEINEAYIETLKVGNVELILDILTLKDPAVNYVASGRKIYLEHHFQRSGYGFLQVFVRKVLDLLLP